VKCAAVRASSLTKQQLRSSPNYKWYALSAVMLGTFMSYWDWRWIFLINVPISIVALLVSAFVLRREERKEERFDFSGAAPLPSPCSLRRCISAQCTAWFPRFRSVRKSR
jgi:MFS family permease